jgi:hypothetical protein
VSNADAVRRITDLIHQRNQAVSNLGVAVAERIFTHIEPRWGSKHAVPDYKTSTGHNAPMSKVLGCSGTIVEEIAEKTGESSCSPVSGDGVLVPRALADYVSHPAYATAQLRQDQDRFTFLLGGDDGESLSRPDLEQ